MTNPSSSKGLLRTILVVVGALGVVAILCGFGYLAFSARSPHGPASAPPSSGEAASEWTCSMHPQIRRPKPGKCPICFMDLIPVTRETQEDSPRRLILSAAARRLAEIETSPVERRFVDAEVRLVGRVAYDETRVKAITAWIAGRIERLFVDYTGTPVRQGDHLVEIYSPELITAQEELLQALRLERDARTSRTDLARGIAESTVLAARRKLRLLGLTAEQIAAVESGGAASERLTVYAPLGGIVIGKDAVQGAYVEKGTRIYTIADLSKVWLLLDAYESDLARLRYGQPVRFTVEAYPGETFEGMIAFIAPALNPDTRTAQVRVNVDNVRGRFRPDMLARATVAVRVGAGGAVVAPALAGAWMCPMHPEATAQAAGKCSICGMALVTAESLGYALAEQVEAPLIIPDTAPLLTGVRAVVYVEVSSGDAPAYEAREVLLGPHVGGYYVVLSDLTEGERVVTRGNFKIDSSLQILAKRSMMSPESEPSPEKTMPESATPHEAAPEAFNVALRPVWDAYLALWRALAGDDLAQARSAVALLQSSVASASGGLLEGDSGVAWQRRRINLVRVAQQAASAEDIEGVRMAFATLSNEMIALLRSFPQTPGRTLHRFHCPMSSGGRGADWLQEDADLLNPYFGAAMLKCGAEVPSVAAPRRGERRHE